MATAIYTNNKSGYRGVYLSGSKWIAQIRVDGVAHHLGSFDSPEDASKAYKSAFESMGIADKRHPKETHNMSKTKLYRVWNSMRMRCSSPSQNAYKTYGGRGIKVCDEWMENFQNFYNDMGSSYKDGLTIERINNDGNYEPGNCRWATQKEQARNTSRSRFITINGDTKTLSEWIEHSKLKSSTVRQRYYVYGWNIERALGIGG